MEPNPGRLSRLQLFGTLFIVLIVASSMGGYFLVSLWSELSSQQDTVSRQTESRERGRLQTYSDHIGLTLAALRDHSSTMLRQHIRDQGDQAYDIARGIWLRSRGSRSRAAIGQQIIASLRPLSYHHGQDTFFIATRAGFPLLQPDAPAEPQPLSQQDATGQRVASGLIAAASNPQQRGFSYFAPPLLAPTPLTDRIAYARRFPPLHWVIGVSESIAYADQDLQRQGLDLLAQLQQGSLGNFIVIDHNGILRMYPPDPSMVGQYYLALPADMRNATLSMLATNRAGGFVGYPMQGQAYLAYVSRLPGWGWTLATSIPCQQLLDSKRAARRDLRLALYQRVHATLWMTLIALCASALFSWMFARWMTALFDRYRGDLWASHQELKQRSRELLLSRFMMDHASEIICLMDRHARLAYQNDLARACLGPPGPEHDQALQSLFKASDLPLPQTYALTLAGRERELHLEVTQDGIEYEGECYRMVWAREVSARVAVKQEGPPAAAWSKS